MWHCTQCGELTEDSDFVEGVCRWCATNNQHNLNLHNAQYNRWQSLSDKQRDDEIKRAYL